MLVTPADAWKTDAPCASLPTSTFFPERETVAVKNALRACCAPCPVRVQCVQSAIDNEEEHGYWGGMSAKTIRNAADRGMSARQILFGTNKRQAA